MIKHLDKWHRHLMGNLLVAATIMQECTVCNGFACNVLAKHSRLQLCRECFWPKWLFAMEQNVFGCLEQHDLLVLAFFLHHVRWYNYVFLRRALKYFIFHLPNLPPCKKGLFAPDMEFICGSNTVWDKCLSKLSSSSPVSVNNIMGFKYDQIVKQTIYELRGNKTTLTKKKKKNRKKCLFKINGTRDFSSACFTYRHL